MDPEDADAPLEARPPLLEDLVSLCRDLAPDDLDRYVVVRVADEFVVDLMKSACGIDYAEASRLVDVVEIQGVAFLARLLESRGEKAD